MNSINTKCELAAYHKKKHCHAVMSKKELVTKQQTICEVPGPVRFIGHILLIIVMMATEHATI